MNIVLFQSVGELEAWQQLRLNSVYTSHGRTHFERQGYLSRANTSPIYSVRIGCCQPQLVVRHHQSVPDVSEKQTIERFSDEAQFLVFSQVFPTRLLTTFCSFPSIVLFLLQGFLRISSSVSSNFSVSLPLFVCLYDHYPNSNVN